MRCKSKTSCLGVSKILQQNSFTDSAAVPVQHVGIEESNSIQTVTLNQRWYGISYKGHEKHLPLVWDSNHNISERWEPERLSFPRFWILNLIQYYFVELHQSIVLSMIGCTRWSSGGPVAATLLLHRDRLPSHKNGPPDVSFYFFCGWKGRKNEGGKRSTQHQLWEYWWCLPPYPRWLFDYYCPLFYAAGVEEGGE